MGYSTERFRSEPSADLICTICSDVLEDPVQRVDCEHYFCRQCITTWLERQQVCPIDRQPLTPNELQEAPRLLKSFLNDLDIRCDFAPQGCQEFVKLERLEGHLMDCPFNPQTIVECSEKCGAIFLRIERSDHSCLSFLKEQKDKYQKQLKELKTRNKKLKGENRELTEKTEKTERLVRENQQEMNQLMAKNRELTEKTERLVRENQLKMNQLMAQNKSLKAENRKKLREEEETLAMRRELKKVIEEKKTLIGENLKLIKFNEEIVALKEERKSLKEVIETQSKRIQSRKDDVPLAGPCRGPKVSKREGPTGQRAVSNLPQSAITPVSSDHLSLISQLVDEGYFERTSTICQVMMSIDLRRIFPSNSTNVLFESAKLFARFLRLSGSHIKAGDKVLFVKHLFRSESFYECSLVAQMVGPMGRVVVVTDASKLGYFQYFCKSLFEPERVVIVVRHPWDAYPGLGYDALFSDGWVSSALSSQVKMNGIVAIYTHKWFIHEKSSNRPLGPLSSV